MPVGIFLVSLPAHLSWQAGIIRPKLIFFEKCCSSLPIFQAGWSSLAGSPPINSSNILKYEK